MTWQAHFPDSVRVRDQWVCDVTLENGSEKFQVTVTYDHSIEECLPQLRAATAKRDAVTLKPTDMIPPGTVITVDEPSADILPASKEELQRAAVLSEMATFDRALAREQRLARYPQDLQDRIVAAGLLELI